MARKKLSWCDDCKENSVTTKVSNRKSDGKRTRVEYCINTGCGYRLSLPFLIVFVLILFSPLSVSAESFIHVSDQIEITNILYGESADDPEGVIAKLNTYYKVRYVDNKGFLRHQQSILSSMRQVSSAYRLESHQYVKAKYNMLNEFERAVYCEILWKVKEFRPDPEWQYIHHENIDDLYESREQAITHLKRVWGGGVDYQNYTIIGKEAYFKAVE